MKALGRPRRPQSCRKRWQRRLKQPPEAALTLVERPVDLGAGQVYPPGKPTPREAFETLGKIVREVTRETGVSPSMLTNLKAPDWD